MSTVAILGASPDRTKFGNKAVRAHLRAGWEVFPVNLTATEIEGLPAYGTVQDIPVANLDRVSIYVPPEVAINVLDEMSRVRPREVWLNPGVDSADVIAKAERLELNYICGCSIVDTGFQPFEFADK
jgi:uncharacterized protein